MYHCMTFHHVQSGLYNWQWLCKGLPGQKGNLFPSCSLEKNSKDRIHVGCGEARLLKPLLWSLREQSLSSALTYLKAFYVWVLNVPQFSPEGIRVIFEGFISFKSWYEAVCQKVLLEEKTTNQPTKKE